jgi:D-cysteine desulfhydrase
LATAIFGKRLGMHTTLILFKQPLTDHVKQTLLLFTNYKARLIYKRTLFNAMLWYYLFGRIRYPDAYYLYPGGSYPVGTIGYVDAAFELKQQIQNGQIPQPSVIFCPLGSGGTLAGLALGIALAGLPISIVGIRVSPARLGPIPATTIGTVTGLMKQTYAYLKKVDKNLPDCIIRPPTIIDAYLGDGYGHPTVKGMAAYQRMKENEGIDLDPTYTAKTLAAVLDYCDSKSTPAQTILFWNTYNGVDLTDAAASYQL